MFLPGEKVVCVNDVFPEGIKKFYWKLPVKGVTYTIRDLVPGHRSDGRAGRDVRLPRRIDQSLQR